MGRRHTAVADVGRVGALDVHYVRQNGKTIISRASCTSPWHLFPPVYLDETGSAYTLLLNPSGGLVGGDRLSIDMRLSPQAHVIISTPSANRVYRSPSKTLPSVQTIRISVEAGAIVEWVPEHTIPFAGSRFRQAIQISLAAGATVVLWDALASGRVAQGERWAFASLDNEIIVATAAGGSLIERYSLDREQVPDAVGMAQTWNYVGSLYIVSDVVTEDVLKTLESRIVEILNQHPGELVGGVSVPAVSGLAVKLLARSGPVFTATLEALWAAVRQVLWGLSPAILRKY